MRKGKEEVGSICKGNGSGGNVYPVNREILLKAAPQLIMLLKRDAQRLYGMPVVGEWGWERSSNQLLPSRGPYLNDVYTEGERGG